MATALPSSQPAESADFAQQVSILVNKFLSDEDQAVYSHFTQAYGFLMLSVTLARVHNTSRDSFLQLVRRAWDDAEKHITVEEQP